MATNTVTRTDLIEAIHEEVGLPRSECAELLEDVLKTVAGCLVEGGTSRFPTLVASRCATRLNAWGAIRGPAKNIRSPRARWSCSALH